MYCPVTQRASSDAKKLYNIKTDGGIKYPLVPLSAAAMSSPSHLFLLLCSLLALFAAGCQQSGIDRLPIHGTVQTAAGEKFDASISFQPLDGKRPVANGSVKNGEYRFDRSKGPTAGRARVVVRRIVRREESLPSRSRTSGRSLAKDVSTAPREWTLTADVRDDGKYVQDFVLKD